MAEESEALTVLFERINELMELHSRGEADDAAVLQAEWALARSMPGTVADAEAMLSWLYLDWQDQLGGPEAFGTEMLWSVVLGLRQILVRGEGVLEARRHACCGALLGEPHAERCVNRNLGE